LYAYDDRGNNFLMVH